MRSVVEEIPHVVEFCNSISDSLSSITLLYESLTDVSGVTVLTIMFS